LFLVAPNGAVADRLRTAAVRARRRICVHGPRQVEDLVREPASIASIVLGVVVFFWTGMSALALLYVIGTYAVVFGVFEIAGAFSLPLIDNTGRVILAVGRSSTPPPTQREPQASH
jgi:hypothetical protein